MQKVEAHGWQVLNEKGLMASVRRACSAVMQMPTGSCTTEKMVVQATVLNIPRRWIAGVVLAAGWTREESKQGHHEFSTDYPKALGLLLSLEKLDSILGQGCAKLYKPEREPRSKAVLAAVPPGRVVHRVRDDGSEVLEVVFHLGVINEVRTAHTAQALRCAPLALSACV